MKSFREIYLNSKFVPKEDWQELIKTVSTYNGTFKKWKIVITNDKNKIQFFTETKCSLPATINNLTSFILKEKEKIDKMPKVTFSIPFTSFKHEYNLIDIINLCEVRNKGEFTAMTISIKPRTNGLFKTKIFFYLTKDVKNKKYKMLFTNPINLLSIDFDGNKRYFYKGTPKYLDINKSLHLLNTDSASSILKVDTFPYLQGDFYLNQNNYSFNKHSIVMGSSGTGKSKFISLLIHNIYKNINLKQQYKVVVIDPHAALENDIGGIGKVIDFKSRRNSIDLFSNSTDDIISNTELLMELFKSIIGSQFNSKLERVLRHSISLLLTNKDFSFTSLRKLLLDMEYRNNLVKELTDKLNSSVVEFFLSDFNELKTKSYGEAISPIIGFIDEMEMIPVFNGEASSNTIKDTIHDNFLTIFSLDRTKLGDKITKTISGLIMQQILTLVQSARMNEHIIFIVDEVAVVESPILSRFLSEARKYNLSLMLAGQYFNQISDELKDSIFANVVNYYIFRVSMADAQVLVNNFDMKVPLDDTKERKVKILSELNNRECIVRIDSKDVLLPAFKAKTMDYTSIPRVDEEVFDLDEVKPNVIKEQEIKFDIGTSINLKDILINTSSSRKVVGKDGR